jgi:hypothetical protein
MKDTLVIDEGAADTKNAAKKTPPDGEKKEFRLRILIPPGQKIPIGIAS